MKNIFKTVLAFAEINDEMLLNKTAFLYLRLPFLPVDGAHRHITIIFCKSFCARALLTLKQ
jgi:hypothetical protein